MVQFVGKPVDKFQIRWNNYRNFVKGQTCMQQHLFEHFANEGQCSFLEEATITFIDKTHPKDLNRHCWRDTLAPLGLNVIRCTEMILIT